MPMAFLTNPLKGNGQKIQWHVQTSYKKISSEDLLGLVGVLPGPRSIHKSVMLRALVNYNAAFVAAGKDKRGLDGYPQR